VPYKLSFYNNNIIINIIIIIIAQAASVSLRRALSIKSVSDYFLQHQ